MGARAASRYGIHTIPHHANSLVATAIILSMHGVTVLKFAPNYAPIKALPVELTTMRRPIGLITLKDRALSPVAHLFIACARDLAQSMVGGTTPARSRRAL